MLHHTLGILRRLGRSYPRIWRVTERVRISIMHTLWSARNLITHKKPFAITVNSGLSVLLHPSGQIAKAHWTNDFEAREREFVAYFVRPGMTVLNVGANSGLYCILM